MKEAKLIKEQIEILKSRNLQILCGNDKIKSFLQNNNYYRVTGYLYKYKMKNSENFTDEINFEKLLEIYKFDESLRSLISKILGVIEISFKTYIAYTIAINYGPLGYLYPENFYNQQSHADFLNIVRGLVNQRKNKKRIGHNIKKSGENLPIWVLVGILSFNNVHHLFENMLKVDRDEINKSFLREFIHPKIVSKWLFAFALLRNDCAHHERLYYEELPNIDIKTKVVKSELKNQNNTLFTYLLCACHLIYDKKIWIDFLEDLEAELNKYEQIDISKIGFPNNWKEILLEEF